MTIINIDMDGVLVDFDQGLRDLYGDDFKYDEIADQFWNRDAFMPSGFAVFPELEAGMEMLELVELQQPTLRILSSTGGGRFHTDIALGKMHWLNNNISDFNGSMVFCPGAWTKADFCRAGDVLIDDNEKTCNEWRERGGIAVHFTPDTWLEKLQFQGVLSANA